MKEISNDLFYKIGESANDGYFIYNLQTENFAYINFGLANIWEIEKEALFHKPHLFLDKIYKDDVEHVVSCYEECLEDMEPKKYEFRLGFENSREKYVKVSLYPFNNESTIICGIAEDITVERHNKLHIEQINYRKNITLEVLSHDLKEPLGMMKLTASSMEKEIAKTGDKSLQRSLNFIADMCDRNTRLIRSVINHEFIKSNVVELKKDRLELVWELKDALRYYRRSRLSQVRNFKFSSNKDKIYLPLDGMKFLQVINNLISNSIKFTDENGTIGITANDLGDSVIISVHDNGRGIPEEMRSTLFERAEQGFRAGLVGRDSGGLGLGIIHNIVKSHDGRIWFETETGKGTTFYVELPK
ncbi:sensor histidine kinase [Pedobacter agri]|uniref:sensor histidine kinase n=1 Tax=Pedobacter agri TaxID=454586 RepID=UPI0029302973|nr:ATP-binding protein [Pedobacter agri]